MKKFSILTFVCIFFITLCIWGTWLLVTKAADTTQSNCDKIHNLYTSIDQILEENDVRIDRALKKGHITAVEAIDSRVFNAKSRETLKKGDCQE